MFTLLNKGMLLALISVKNYYVINDCDQHMRKQGSFLFWHKFFLKRLKLALKLQWVIGTQLG